MATVKRADTEAFKNADLVLKVNGEIDPKIWDESRYEAFLDQLCGERRYQKEAILETLRYILGGRYSVLRDLALENFRANDDIRRRYGSFLSMEQALQLPDQLSCSLDLATGTGKSFVIYGVATILLAERIVDRVLVLCPSNTIERGLLQKFRDLAGDAELRMLLPDDSIAPRIITASETIAPGCLCVENYHAVLEHVGSSIAASLKGNGHRTAVFSDEVHHITNESRNKVGKWKKFLLDPSYGFKIHVGVSGTCYSGDEYFADVIYRYSLRQAMEERFVKRVEYATETPATVEADEKWQLVYNKHQDIKRKFQQARRNIRPLTIVVTRDVATCERVADEIEAFLRTWARFSAEDAAAAVLVVTSARQHQANYARLGNVDAPSSKVEWIVSVSMLTEGWDVKNVFQIIPHEERAFNSKLLIAQVLGRGLRIPEGWRGEQPTVTVFNHDAWSSRIRQLLNEVLELEKRISSVVDKDSPYNFTLNNLDYTREPSSIAESPMKGEYKLLARGYVELPTQTENLDVVVEFERALTAERTRFQTNIQFRTYGIDEVAQRMYDILRTLDEESLEAEDPADRTSYAKQFTLARCREVVVESLKRAGVTSGRITEETRQKLLQALGTLMRRSSKRVSYSLTPKQLVLVPTSNRHAESCGASELRRGERRIFYTEGCERLLPAPMVEFFRQVIEQDGEFDRAAEMIQKADFKTPLNLVITEANPERKFVRNLCARRNSVALDSWLKNTPQRFYSIEYAWKKGTYAKRGEFSPDFFLKVGAMILVVEIKDDGEINDPSPENIKKYQFAEAHFQRLNQWHSESAKELYQLNFLTPRDYDKFFQRMRESNLVGFKSELDIALAAASRR